MATGKRKGLSHSVINASEEVAENPCCFCISRDKKEIESTNYCVECDSNMCKGCTEWHANFPPMTSHRVVGISKASSAKKSQDQLPTQRCEVHSHKILERFCIDHNQLACDSCAIQDHRKCENLEYIPVFCKGIKTSQELVATKTSTKSVLKTLKEFQSTQQKTLQKLDTAELQCQQDLQDHTDKLIKRINELAKVDSAMIKSKFQRDKNAVKQIIKDVDSQIVTMETIVKGLNHSKGDNEPELFVYMKQGDSIEKASQQLLYSQQNCHKQIPKYSFLNNIEKSIGDIKALVEFERTERLKPISLKLRGVFNVKTARDEECCISGACYLPDGSVMMADIYNDCLKQLDSSYKVARSLYLAGAPIDVCYTDNNEVAMIMLNEQVVKFVCLGATLKITRSFYIGFNCKGITSSNGELFVCGRTYVNDHTQTGYVQVFSMSGTPLRTIHLQDTTGHPFRSPDMIIASSCDNKLYLPNVSMGLIITDTAGNFQQNFIDRDLKNASGLCTLDDGDLLVSCYDKILHMSRDGRRLGVALDKKVALNGDCLDQLHNPSGLVFDPIYSRLIVTRGQHDTIWVFDVI